VSYATVPFKRWHLAWLQEDGDAEGGMGAYVSQEDLPYLERMNSYTFICDDKPILCGGTMRQWRNRHMGWAYLNKHSGQHMLAITRAAIAHLDAVVGRIDFTVRRDFAAGHRWARLLGFVVENPPGILTAYGPEQEDHIAYWRFN
jgi:hypothetical protein